MNYMLLKKTTMNAIKFYVEDVEVFIFLSCLEHDHAQQQLEEQGGVSHIHYFFCSCIIFMLFIASGISISC